MSKINLNNSLKINNKKYSNVSLGNDKDFNKILENLKDTYEDHWKKNNEINTSIKLPITISIDSKNYEKIAEIENLFNSIDLISDFYILKFNNQNTQYRIIFNGSPKSFFNRMSKKNFHFIMKNDVWTIK